MPSGPPGPARRFLTLEDVAEELATSRAQVYALVRSGDLAAIKIGGRGQWRVERSALESWIAQCYVDTAEWIRTHQFDTAQAQPEIAPAVDNG